MYKIDKIRFAESDLLLWQNKEIPKYIPVLLNGIKGYYYNGSYFNNKYIPYFLAKTPNCVSNEVLYKKENVNNQMNFVLSALGMKEINRRLCEDFEMAPNLRLYDFSQEIDCDIQLFLEYENPVYGQACGTGYSKEIDCNIGFIAAGKWMEDSHIYLLKKNYATPTISEIQKNGIYIGSEIECNRNGGIGVKIHQEGKDLSTTIKSKDKWYKFIYVKQ